MPENYYDLLGVPKNASKDDIKKAFRRLARDRHPDANLNDPNATRRMQELNEAYEVLSDDEKRAHYDKLGMTRPVRDAGPVADMRTDAQKLADMFVEIFSGRGGPDIFGGSFGFGGFTPKPGREKPVPPPAKSEVVEREVQIRKLEDNIRNAPNIHAIRMALASLAKLEYSFIIKGFSPEDGHTKTKLTCDQVLSFIDTAQQNRVNDPVASRGAIQLLPEELSIQWNVDIFLQRQSKAFRELRDVKATYHNTLSSLENLDLEFDNLDTKDFGRINIQMQLALVREVTNQEVYWDHPERVDMLIAQITKWNDLDLKVYHFVRDTLWLPEAREKYPVPASLLNRYNAFKKRIAIY